MMATLNGDDFDENNGIMAKRTALGFRSTVSAFLAITSLTALILASLAYSKINGSKGACAPGQYIIYGPRIPYQYYRTKGAGNSSVAVETGSYDAALTIAGIENANIMKYTSVLPPESAEISRQQFDEAYAHGQVLETIMAQTDGAENDLITAGIHTVRLNHKDTGKSLGGFVVEYPSSESGVGSGSCGDMYPCGVNATKAQAEKNLHDAMHGLLERRYGPEWMKTYKVVENITDIVSKRVTEKFGTVLVALAFTSYIYPAVRCIDTLPPKEGL